MDRETYTTTETADYINQHFVAVKVDFDASPQLVAQLQRAQAVLNLPAGLRCRGAGKVEDSRLMLFPATKTDQLEPYPEVGAAARLDVVESNGRGERI
jgi:hypothetical protein